jgi:peptide/nickel transport system substrate-binding protein
VSYWERLLRPRLSRRRLVVGSAAAGAGLVALGVVGCGGSGGNGAASNGQSSGLLTKAVDTSKSARPGGVYKGFVVADARGFDPHVNITGASADSTDRVYSRLTMFAPGLDGKFPDGTLEPDAATSWEMAGDGLQITYKLRPDLKLDQRPPTNGRSVDAEDVVFSWKRIEQVHPFRNGLANSVSADAPILSMTAPDSRTVVVKLAFQNQEILTDLSRGSQRFSILPREADGGFDPRNEQRGSSAWILSDYRPSSLLSYSKNPNWWRKDRPFFDKYEQPIIPEYATRLAQFRAGGIYYGALRLEDTLAAKQDDPRLLLYADEWSATVEPTIRFGLASPDAPFWDQRVRQAFSMLLDRETWTRTFGAVDKFQAVGLPTTMRWMTHAGVEGAPQPLDKDFGPNAKYYMYNPAEAKKLLSAAGYPDGFTTDALYRSDGTAVFPQYDALVGMLKDGGIKVNVKVVDRVNVFDKNVRNGHGNWDGFSFDIGGASPSVAAFLWRRYASTGTVFAGFDGTGGKDRMKGDPYVDDVTNKMVREADKQKKQALIDDFIRYMAEKMYEVPAGGQAQAYRVVWPVVQNFGVFRTIVPGVENDIHLWLDTSKPPVAS